MPLAWSPCLLHGLHAFGAVSMPLARSPCLWRGLHAFGEVSVPLAAFPCLWRSFQAFGVVFMPLVWSACLWHGLQTCRTAQQLLLAFLAFLAFLTLFFLLCRLWNFVKGQTGDHGILWMVSICAHMCGLPPLSMAISALFRP